MRIKDGGKAAVSAAAELCGVALIPSSHVPVDNWQKNMPVKGKKNLDNGIRFSGAIAQQNCALPPAAERCALP